MLDRAIPPKPLISSCSWRLKIPEKFLKRGVPQESCLSPTNFNVIMSDIPHTDGIIIGEYADDIAILITSDTLEDAHTTPVVSDIVVESAFVVMFGSALAEPPKISTESNFRSPSRSYFCYYLADSAVPLERTAIRYLA